MVEAPMATPRPAAGGYLPRASPVPQPAPAASGRERGKPYGRRFAADVDLGRSQGQADALVGQELRAHGLLQRITIDPPVADEILRHVLHEARRGTLLQRLLHPCKRAPE